MQYIASQRTRNSLRNARTCDDYCTSGRLVLKNHKRNNIHIINNNNNNNNNNKQQKPITLLHSPLITRKLLMLLGTWMVSTLLKDDTCITIRSKGTLIVATWLEQIFEVSPSKQTRTPLLEPLWCIN